MERGSVFGKALVSGIFVFAAGYFGCFLDIAGCLMAMGAVATGCIVYAIYDSKK